MGIIIAIVLGGLAGWIASKTLNLGSFLLAVGGAIILLAIVNLFTRGRVR